MYYIYVKNLLKERMIKIPNCIYACDVSRN